MDYLHLLEQLVQEHGRWRQRRREADDELSRLAGLIRSTVRMLPPEHQTAGEHVFDRIEDRPVGLTAMIRLALAEGGWRTPAQIRDFLMQSGLFASYRSNPLASIHTTLKRMVPDSLETRRERGTGTLYRLRRGQPLARAREGARRLDEIRNAGFTTASGRSWIAVPLGNFRPQKTAKASTRTPKESDKS